MRPADTRPEDIELTGEERETWRRFAALLEGQGRSGEEVREELSGFILCRRRHREAFADLHERGFRVPGRRGGGLVANSSAKAVHREGSRLLRYLRRFGVYGGGG